MTTSTISRMAGTNVATLDLLGGRVSSLVVDGLELLVRAGVDSFHWGSFPMAPWAGRLRRGRLALDGVVVELPVNSPPHALHGLVTDRRWELLTNDQRSASLAIDLGRAASDPWPWPCRVVQSVSLGTDGMDFQLSLHAEQPTPAHLGWHPWFSRRLGPDDGASAELQVVAGRVHLNGADGIPDGRLAEPPARPWDCCFVGLAEPPRVRWPGVLELTVSSDCDYWVLYDAEPGGVCVEPWTGPPNCLNTSGRRIVTAGNPLEASMSWRWRRLPA